MRARRLWNLFDQLVSFRIDHTQHGCLLARQRTGSSRDRAVPTRTRVVATITAVVPHLIRPGDAGDGGLCFGLGIYGECDYVARIVLRRAAQKDIVIRPDTCAVGAAGVEFYYPRILDRIECADDGGGFAELLRYRSQAGRHGR